MAGSFNFCPDSHVAVEIPPEETSVVSFNGWDFRAKPGIPYRPRFRLRLGGMRWYLSGTALDVATNPTLNAGRLLNFYKSNRTWDTFSYQHEYLGLITCRFAEPVNIPEAEPNSNGLIKDFDTVLIHHNPGY